MSTPEAQQNKFFENLTSNLKSIDKDIEEFHNNTFNPTDQNFLNMSSKIFSLEPVSHLDNLQTQIEAKSNLLNDCLKKSLAINTERQGVSLFKEGQERTSKESLRYQNYLSQGEYSQVNSMSLPSQFISETKQKSNYSSPYQLQIVKDMQIESFDEDLLAHNHIYKAITTFTSRCQYGSVNE
mmetsp:Transcript_9986/g.9923  ORF Transcript_9986/g.9923 Transcript_9986/m.9923 type:complete len:182 (+) Transcript_9986:120-665(+)